MSLRGLPYAVVPVLALLLAASASAGVTLPISNFSCILYEGTGPGSPGFPPVPGSTCNAAATQLAAPSAPGITGVSFGTTSDVTWNPAGQLNGGVNYFPPNGTPQTTLDTLVMQTSGPINGNPGDQFTGSMPVNYSFSITPVSCDTYSGGIHTPCDPTTTVSVVWSLGFLIQGHGVSNPDGARGSVRSPNYFTNGNDIGSFSGGLSIPAPGGGGCILNPPGPPICPSAPATTISQNSDPNTVSVYLGLLATLPEDVSATYAISVPQAGSFDFRSAENAPEPATMGLLAAGLLLFGCRRLTSRS